MEFAIFVWLASVVPTVKWLLWWPVVVVLLYSACKTIKATTSSDAGYTKKYAPEEYAKAMEVLKFKWIKWPAIFVTTLAVISTLLPTERTMYMMAAAYGSQQLVQSEAAEKVVKIINSKLDQYVDEIDQKVKN